METASEARIGTTLARRYLGQLCKHFAHKLQVDLAEAGDAGRLIFGAGVCSLQADDAELRLRIDAASPEDAVVLQGVVERHLARFAFREPPVVVWQLAG